MRKIKFRVWHKNEKRWLDPWAEEDPMLSLKDCGEGCEVFLYERDSGDWSNKNCLMKDIVIQQYTGLKDKNGKDIYEGDIVRYRQHMFNTEKTRTKEKEIGFDRFCGCFNVYETNAGQDEHEVIGNIFEGVDK
jgi:uncharacterized phage protein (TIGR01671 family)